jgi:eukaryotic-like serine/threonine-protein kinase
MNWRHWMRHLGLLATVWGVLLGGTMLWLRFYSQPSAQREVPQVTGLGRDEAQILLSELGLEAVMQDSIYAAGGKPGQVVDQFPPPGSAVKVGRKVLLTTYRTTPPSERVGIQEGQDAKLAERILTTRGFDVHIREEAHGLLVGKALRVEHKGKRVQPDDRLPKGSRLSLVVGVAGTREVGVPWLVGLSLREAQEILSRRKLSVGDVAYGDDILTALDSSLAVVVSQDASPMDQPKIREGTAIDLYLGKH